ncbi:hypothetical protein D3C78_1828980 [compost metagenome]
MIVQMLRAADVQGSESCRVTDVDDDGTLLTQGLGLFRGDTFEFAHGGFLLLG